MNDGDLDRGDGQRAGLREPVLALALCWLLHFFSLSVTSYILSSGATAVGELLWRRAIVSSSGILTGLAIWYVVRRIAHWRLWLRVVVLVIAAFAAAVLHTFINWCVFFVVFSLGDEATLSTHVINWSAFFFVYLAITGMLVALDFNQRLRARDRSLAEMRHAAQQAQLRLLRYQINPHFLFNTLNSVAALLRDRAIPQAEQMVEELSDFFRYTLAMNPLEDIPLWREIELQRLYLGIEQVRFPERLAVVIDCPDAARDALVPSLILQPLVENSVKHAVARSGVRVTVTIRARLRDSQLQILISDDGGDAPGASREGGTSTGLTNVRLRLASRPVAGATFQAGPLPGRGFASTISLPMRFSP